MRTTIRIDDDIFRQVRSYAESRSLGFGQAVEELLERGLVAERSTRSLNGLQVFDLPDDSPVVRSGRVRELESEP